MPVLRFLLDGFSLMAHISVVDFFTEPFNRALCTLSYWLLGTKLFEVCL